MKLLKSAPKVLVFALASTLGTAAMADNQHHVAVGVHVSTTHHVDPRGAVWGHGDIRQFHDHDLTAWRGGHWIHDWHNNHFGWWWVVGGAWIFFNAPAYPYPDPYVPSTVVVEQPAAQPAAAPAPPAPAPTYWYYCASAQNYYPYVTQCPVGWEQVPATPSAPNTAPSATPAPPPPPPPSNDGNW